jgi:hypothetical protein
MELLVLIIITDINIIKITDINIVDINIMDINIMNLNMMDQPGSSGTNLKEPVPASA